MKVIFICGCLESGRDGVGDYVVRLGGEMIRQGLEIVALALNDPYVSKPTPAVLLSGGSAISALRLPGNLEGPGEIAVAQKYLHEFGPDLVSFQYVPYSFHEKGISFRLPSKIKKLVGKHKVQIMFHEMWLDSPVNLKQRLVAVIQQLLLRRMVSGLNTVLVNVSVPFNKRRLNKIGIAANVLGLFGNIYQDSPELLRQPDLNLAWPSVLYFGSPPKGAFLANLVDKLEAFCQVETSATIVLACGNSKGKDQFLFLLKERLSGYQCKLVDMGFLDIPTLSKLMSECTVGIARSSVRLLGKSGSAIAMLEHGLPLWMPKWDGVEPLELGFREELIRHDLRAAVRSERSKKYLPLLSNIAQEFIQQLANKVGNHK